MPPLEIPIASETLPDPLRRIELNIGVAGRQFHVPIGIPSSSERPLRYSFQWDGLDSFGRRLYGPQRVFTDVGYVYGGSYQRTERFGYNGSGLVIAGSKDRFEVTLSQRWSGWLDQWDARSAGLGGWSLNIHHSYDPRSGMVHLGNGGRLDTATVTPQLVTIAGNGQLGFSGDGGPAVNATVNLKPSFSNSSLAVAPDGTVYFADAGNNRIRRIGLDGVITTVAGGGGATSYPHGDGGPATDATFSTPTGIAIGADGSLYVTDKFHRRIRRIAPDGIITTVVGTGGCCSNGDGPALTRLLLEPTGITSAPDGTIYFTDNGVKRFKDGYVSTVPGSSSGYLTQPAVGKDGTIFYSNYHGNTIEYIGTDAIARPLAGPGSGPFPYGEGGPATSAAVLEPDGVAVGPDGLVYFADTGHGMVRRVNGDGTIETVVGTGTPAFNGDNLPATRANISRIRGLGLGPDGSIYVVDTDNHRIRKTTLPPALTAPDGTRSIPSYDGGSVFVFSAEGRHLKTIDAFTGSTQLAFEYDAEGLLTAVADRELNDPDARITEIVRDDQGRPLVVISPDGQQTILEVDASDNLRSVTNPAGGVHSFEYTSGGLLAGMRDPKGNAEGTAAFEFTFDDNRLVSDQDPLGNAQTLARSNLAQGVRVTHSTPLGRVTTYDRQNLDPLLVDQQTTGPDGLIMQTLTRLDGKPTLLAPNGSSYSSQVSRPDRSSIFFRLDPDSTFGLGAPVVSERLQVMGTGPDALARSIQSSRSIVHATPGDPASVVQVTETKAVNGKTTSSVYDAATRTFTTTSPAGRTTLRSIDERGRTVRLEVDGILPSEFVYDEAGRLLQSSQGDRVSSFTYFQNSGPTNGYLASTTDAEDHTTTYTRDALGRATEQSLAGIATGFGYDPNGNLTSVTPPARPQHGQSYTALNQMSLYAPPSAGLPASSTAYAYNADRDLLTTARPDGITVTRNYDSAGRLDDITFGSNLIDYEYYANTTGPGVAPGRLSAIRGAYGVDLTYGYLGSLTTSTAWSGEVQGNVAWAHDTDFRRATESVSGATGTSTVNFGYDLDSLLICASPTTCAPPAADALTLTRDPQNGSVTELELGSTTESLTYNAFGELSDRVGSISGTSTYSVEYDSPAAARDHLGRVVRKTETIQGVTRVEDYTYDAHGRLTDVLIDGTITKHWEYDPNGNRVLAEGPDGTVTATYDDQDRLLEYGDFVYTYGPNGELESKTDTTTGAVTTYQYDALGNLRTVTLPSGGTIVYDVDGVGRRVAKRVDGVIVRRWLYRDQLKPVAELDGSGALIEQFVYGSHPTVPDYVIKGGTVFRIFSDQLGSPRLVVDATTGAIAQRMRHDEFGNVLEDSVPGFVPFGFAGGLYDPDTGLVRFGARDYDPLVGRWTSKDPIRFEGGQANIYAYVGSDPANGTDPSGLISLGDAWAIGATCFEECSARNPYNPLGFAGCMAGCTVGACVWEERQPYGSDPTKSNDELIKACQQHASAAQQECQRRGFSLNECLNVYLIALRECIARGRGY